MATEKLSGMKSVAFCTETLLVMTRSLHCFTLSRDGRAESDFGQKMAKQAKLYSLVNIKSITKGNQQDEKFTQNELGSQIQEDNR